MDELSKECGVLEKFTENESPGLPCLSEIKWKCSPDVLFNLFLPLATPLPISACKDMKNIRQDFLVPLRSDFAEALIAAHNMGYCHCDLRPDNIVVTSDYKFVIIEWGLACGPGEPMHQHSGGLPFFHDDIVRHRDAKEPKALLLYKTDYDFKSIDFIVYWFHLFGDKTLQHLPWFDCC